MTCLPPISDCPSPHGIAQNGRKTHAALPQTARRQSRQRLSHHRTPLPGKQGPLRPKLPQTRIHRYHLRRRPPRRDRRGRRLKDDLVACYQPVNSQDLFAIERIAPAQQALLRAARLENGMFTTCLNESLTGSGKPLVGISPELCNGDMEVTKVHTRNYLLAEGFHRLIHYSNSWALFLRYQAQTERLGVPSGPRAIEDFERLKALRHELPNKPIVEAQPEPKETTCIPGPTKPLTPENPAPEPPSPAPPSQPTLEPAPVPAGAFRIPPEHPDTGKPVPPLPRCRIGATQL